MIEDLRGLLSGALLTFAALFPIVNPLAIAPIFLSLTRDLTVAQRRVLALKVAINGFLLLLGTLLVGDYVLTFFGVSVPVVQLAGGLVVASLGWRLLHAPDEDPEARTPETWSAMESKALYPLTLPLTVGPGAISVAITIGANFPSTPQPFLFDVTSSTIGILAVAISAFLCFAYADRVSNRLGPHGLTVVMKLSAFILLCIGIQIMWNGTDSLFGITKR
jgi:multiple antibiotic resistance protein